MRTVTLELDGSPLADSLSLVASALRVQQEIRIDDSWLAHHGCGVKPYDRFREALAHDLDAAGISRRAVAERSKVRVMLAVCGRPLLRADLHLADPDRCVGFTRVSDE